MAKRFIDTELFCDEWFCDLPKDSKLFFLYFITRCDHAGILRLNNKLCEFQTGIKSIETVIKDLGNCLVTVKTGVYFLPKYIKYQYPEFPKSTVKQQEGALKILISFGLWDEENNTLLNSCQTVREELPNSYVYVNDNVIVKEIKESKIKYGEFVTMAESDYQKLLTLHGEELTNKFIEKLNNYKGSSGKKYKDDYRAILSWVVEDVKKNINQKPAFSQKSNAANGGIV